MTKRDYKVLAETIRLTVTNPPDLKRLCESLVRKLKRSDPRFFDPEEFLMLAGYRAHWPKD